jgi:hypothetical protein
MPTHVQLPRPRSPRTAVCLQRPSTYWVSLSPSVTELHPVDADQSTEAVSRRWACATRTCRRLSCVAAGYPDLAGANAPSVPHPGSDRRMRAPDGHRGQAPGRAAVAITPCARMPWTSTWRRTSATSYTRTVGFVGSSKSAPNDSNSTTAPTPVTSRHPHAGMGARGLVRLIDRDAYPPVSKPPEA